VMVEGATAASKSTGCSSKVDASLRAICMMSSPKVLLESTASGLKVWLTPLPATIKQNDVLGANFKQQGTTQIWFSKAKALY